MERKTAERIKIYGSVALAMAGIGAAATLHRATLVDWWLLPAVSVLPASALAAVARGWKRRLWVGALLACVLTGGLYAVNYLSVAEPDLTREVATVTERSVRERHHSRRVGRNRYAPGRKYNVYYVAVEFADGTRKSLQVPLSTYNSLKTGGEINVRVGRGVLGLRVFKTE